MDVYSFYCFCDSLEKVLLKNLIILYNYEF